MKPIKLYFAGAISKNTITNFPSNRLVTFAYPSELWTWLRINKGKPGNIIVDSGAFSAWNKGMVVDIYEYIKYSKKAIEKGNQQNKKVYVVNLDNIPGEVGDNIYKRRISNFAVTAVINTAARQGYKNMKIMLDNGIEPIHVFHQGEKFRWLDKMVEKINYIGISPANDVSQKEKYLWVYSVFNYLYKNNIGVDTHGFAVFERNLLLDFPWTSCDAASWKIFAGMGSIFYPYGGFLNADYSKESFRLMVSARSRGREGVGDLSPGILEKLKKDGYSFDDLQSGKTRYDINIRYCLGFEKYINEYKKSTEFVSRRTLVEINEK